MQELQWGEASRGSTPCSVHLILGWVCRPGYAEKLGFTTLVVGIDNMKSWSALSDNLLSPPDWWKCTMVLRASFSSSVCSLTFFGYASWWWERRPLHRPLPVCPIFSSFLTLSPCPRLPWVSIRAGGSLPRLFFSLMLTTTPPAILLMLSVLWRD